MNTQEIREKIGEGIPLPESWTVHRAYEAGPILLALLDKIEELERTVGTLQDSLWDLRHGRGLGA